MAKPQLPLAPAAVRLAHLARERLDGEALASTDAEMLDRMLACSEFIAAVFASDPRFREGPTELDDDPFVLAADCDEESAFSSALRRARRRALATIAWRAVALIDDTPTTLALLSRTADQAIRAAATFARQLLVRRYGVPRDSAGAEQILMVIGMGKLGGGELNFSSDVDLVFLYPDDGVTDGERSIDNFEFFTRLGQTLIRLLDAVTADGFVYRVDMRLRPFGESGPLVSSFSALESYLVEQGRDWERYAWVKARAITGAERYEELFNDVIRPFVYRRYLDFGVLGSLREMHALIAREVEKRELADHVKLGPGGIREIEFIVQALQLVRGGADPSLRSQSLLTVLPRLAGGKLLPTSTVEELERSYEFLRRLENGLQMIADEQVHRLPRDAERQTRLVTMLDFPDWDALLQRLWNERSSVAWHFSKLVFAGEAPLPTVVGNLELAFADATAAEHLLPSLAALAIEEALPIAEQLLILKQSGYYRRLDEISRRRLHGLLSRVLSTTAKSTALLALFPRLIKVIEAIGNRTSYLALLIENPIALTRLVEICALGEFLPNQIAAFPLLLDELVDQRLFDELPTREQFASELSVRVADHHDDAERLVEVLREFQRAAVFRIALLELTDRLPLMQVSDRLTDVAELIIDCTMAVAWREMTAIHGCPMAGQADHLRACGVAAIGYGKLGGRELGYGSDLDLVFLHDSTGEVQETSGPRVIENGVFFLRLGQKIVHFLTMHTAAGRLYEVDMRLRPSGKGGLLMTYVGAFADYQRTEAWTWEHQALLHSRAVAGTPEIRERFEADRLALLRDHVRRASLKSDVRHMRERMRRELSRAGDGQFDIKQDPGGVADIEFLAQYWVLRFADQFAPLLTYSDTIRQLESVGSAALVDHRIIDDLVDAYRQYRGVVHRCSLEGHTPVVPASPYHQTRQRVIAIWDEVMQDGTLAT